MEPRIIKIELGDAMNVFKTGDFLNAIDTVYCYFENFGMSDEQAKQALKTYIKYIGE